MEFSLLIVILLRLLLMKWKASMVPLASKFLHGFLYFQAQKRLRFPKFNYGTF